ncbi:MAG: DUF948 domain-containing protein [Actinomycetota bacterium]|nr:DUF948 domain-containing protein [Actinomycetota bacterium]
MALKILQVTGAAALVVLVFVMIPVLLRLRKTLAEVGEIVGESKPSTLLLLRKAGMMLESVNEELAEVEKITKDTEVLVQRMGQASEAIEKVARSPITKTGLLISGISASGYALKRHLSKEISS